MGDQALLPKDLIEKKPRLLILANALQVGLAIFAGQQLQQSPEARRWGNQENPRGLNYGYFTLFDG